MDRPDLKGYDQQSYPISLTVRVEFPGQPAFVDAVKGLNSGHALHRARWNWGADIDDAIIVTPLSTERI